MPTYDPSELYRRLAKFLGGSPYSKESGNSELWQVPGMNSDFRVSGWEGAFKPSTWDTSEVWKGVAPGAVPDWMKDAVGGFLKGYQGGAITADEMRQLADHWVRGVGKNPAYKGAPDWAQQWLMQQFAPWLSPTGPNPLPGGGQVPV